MRAGHALWHRLPIGEQWALAMALPWLITIGMSRYSGLEARISSTAELVPPSSIVAGTDGSSRQYKVLRQNIVAPRAPGEFGGAAPMMVSLAIPALIVAAGFTAVAAAQQLVLRQRYPISRWWIPATVGAMLVAEALVTLVGTIFVELTLVAAVLGGVLVGTGQYLVLRTHLPSRARLWILAVAMAWTFGALLTLLLPHPITALRIPVALSDAEVVELMAEVSGQAAARAELVAVLRVGVIAAATSVAVQRLLGREVRAY